MKKMLIRGVALGVLLLPGVVFAAFNDAVLTAATITVGGFDLTVTGSNVASVVVNDNSTFTVSMESGSTFSASSADKKNFLTNISAAGVNETDACGTSASTLTLTASASASVTISLSGTCTTASGGGSGGSGGGGGGGSSIVTSTPSVAAVGPLTSTTVATPAVTTTVPATAAARQALITQILAQIAVLQAQLKTAQQGTAAPSTAAVVNASVNASFKRDITVGATGDDVTSLQTFLEGKGFLVMPKNVSKGTFGGLTKKALAQYQKSVGLPATGFFGPMTRASIKP